MLKITTKPVITDTDIENEFGIHIFDYEFAQEASNDSYVRLDLSEDKIYENEEEIKSCPDEPKYCARLQNEINLIKYLRNLGYTDEVLISISW